MTDDGPLEGERAEAVDPLDVTAELPVVSVPAAEPAPDETSDAMPDAVSEPVVAPVAAPVDGGASSHAARRRRRRWPWITLATLLVLVVTIVGAGLWYISGLIGAGAAVPRPRTGFPLTITAVDAGHVAYADPSGSPDDRGLMGMATIEGGYVQTSDPVVAGSGAVSRAIVGQVLPPPPAAGQAGVLDSWYFPRNPKVGLGLDFQDVVYDAPLGPTPAWFIPGRSSTWVVFTHGRGATPLEGLRIASTVSTLGYPMLLIRYRDDPRAPGEDGQGNFGATEWPDLEAAVQYALDHGAKRVVLAGASMGGSTSLAFLQNSALAGKVAGAFLDAPLSDFAQVVEIGARDMGLPGFATSLGMQVASLRYGFDWAATDYTADAASFTTPMLIVQGTADDTVPAVVNEDFAAAARPDVVSLELFEGAGHVMSWNVDRPRYEKLLTDFLARVAP
jgi:alpha-beta hydrolase superfamily lysophospholipase